MRLYFNVQRNRYMKTCPRCKKQNCFRPLKQAEIVSMCDTLAKNGGTHLLCVSCDYLIPKDQIITSFFSYHIIPHLLFHADRITIAQDVKSIRGDRI